MRHVKRFRVIVVTILFTAGVAACSTNDTGGGVTTTGGPAGNEASVTIDDFAFSPGALTVSVGTTITWTNDQGLTHTVTADDGSFDSGRLATGDTFSQTFDTTGIFAYHCTIHPSMTATVIVQS